MCYHNYTRHNGCGHIGECHGTPWTLCQDAEKRLADLRGPTSPPLSPPPQQPLGPLQRHSSKLGRRFASFTSPISRSSTSASSSSRRSVSGPSTTRSRASTSSYNTSGPDLGIPDYQWEAVKCKEGTKKTHVSSEMDVCKECKRWIREMRFVIERFEKTGSVKGTKAFEEFLRFRGEGEALFRPEYGANETDDEE